MTKVQMLGSNTQYVLDLDDEDMVDLLKIQLEKGTCIEETIKACFHAGIVTIQTHSPRKFPKEKNNEIDGNCNDCKFILKPKPGIRICSRQQKLEPAMISCNKFQKGNDDVKDKNHKKSKKG